LHDYKKIGREGTDPRMLFVWYSGDYCTDPRFADLEPELRANPSMSSWPEGKAYLEQQRLRLPTHKFRRLHLNLPGAVDGAFFDQGSVLAAIVTGRRVLPPNPDAFYVGFVDMSGGSADDATLAIAHREQNRTIIDLVVSQDGGIPFNPRTAVRKFVRALCTYRCDYVTGDNFAGNTFKLDFEADGISYRSSPLSKTELYEKLETAVNAGEIELPEIPKLQE
jgi:hypothetical protein